MSVVIPCFNAGRFVSSTIESVLQQTYTDYEVIVIDDGSTDDSRRIIESFGTKIRAEFGPNRGASAARNRGTQLAGGAYVQYLDADDVLLPDALRRRVEALERAGADVAYSDWQYLVEDESGFREGDIVSRTMESIHPDPQIAIFTEFWRPPVAILYSRRIVEKIGAWNETLPIIQDARFLLDAALQGAKFLHVVGVGALYRVHVGQSLSRLSKQKFVRDCLENALQIEAYWRQNGGITSQRRAAILKVLAFITRASFESDPETFYRAFYAGNRLQDSWSPQEPNSLRLLSRLLGYPRAEKCALLYRRLRGTAKQS